MIILNIEGEDVQVIPIKFKHNVLVCELYENWPDVRMHELLSRIEAYPTSIINSIEEQTKFTILSGNKELIVKCLEELGFKNCGGNGLHIHIGYKHPSILNQDESFEIKNFYVSEETTPQFSGGDDLLESDEFNVISCERHIYYELSGNLNHYGMKRCEIVEFLKFLYAN